MTSPSECSPALSRTDCARFERFLGSGVDDDCDFDSLLAAGSFVLVETLTFDSSGGGDLLVGMVMLLGRGL